MKMLKILMNRFAEINPQEDIRLIKLYGIQSYLCELIVYEFQLKYLEIYMAKEVLRIPIPRTWKDMIRAHETISGLLKYEKLLSDSTNSIKDFLWNQSSTTPKMTTKMTTYQNVYNNNKKMRVK
ncbi:15906_t:CDS:2 [Entrophospora sp. SA101]|nr:15906_t:CDS:2 [Entrophospora sp. SA101]CAJ0842020.1 4026_t:CDS:2 [Entrophospora sp. SA101]